MGCALVSKLLNQLSRRLCALLLQCGRGSVWRGVTKNDSARPPNINEALRTCNSVSAGKVDTQRLTAEYNNGVLEIKAPPRESALPRQIEVTNTQKTKGASAA
jgi:hypothetical protein